MAKKSSLPPPSVTAERAGRLYRLLTFLGKGAQTRAGLIRRLQLGIRGFYRDLEILREVGIHIELSEGRYSLAENAPDAVARLPFPDPGLNLGEARELARGRSKAHKKIRQQLAQIIK